MHRKVHENCSTGAKQWSFVFFTILFNVCFRMQLVEWTIYSNYFLFCTWSLPTFKPNEKEGKSGFGFKVPKVNLGFLGGDSDDEDGVCITAPDTNFPPIYSSICLPFSFLGHSINHICTHSNNTLNNKTLFQNIWIDLKPILGHCFFDIFKNNVSVFR